MININTDSTEKIKNAIKNNKIDEDTLNVILKQSIKYGRDDVIELLIVDRYFTEKEIFVTFTEYYEKLKNRKTLGLLGNLVLDNFTFVSKSLMKSTETTVNAVSFSIMKNMDNNFFKFLINNKNNKISTKKLLIDTGCNVLLNYLDKNRITQKSYEEKLEVILGLGFITEKTLSLCFVSLKNKSLSAKCKKNIIKFLSNSVAQLNKVDSNKSIKYFKIIMKGIFNSSINYEYLKNIKINKSTANLVYDKNSNASALHQACATGNYDAVKWLLKNRADPNALSNYNNSALFYVQDEKNADKIIKILCDYGANINQRNVNEHTPLMFICSMSDKPLIAKSLITNGSNINCKDSNGKTALFYACIENNLGQVKVLHKNKAKWTVDDRNCLLPLELAYGCRANEVFNFVKNKNIKDKNTGKDVFKLYNERDKIKVLSMLFQLEGDMQYDDGWVKIEGALTRDFGPLKLLPRYLSLKNDRLLNNNSFKKTQNYIRENVDCYKNRKSNDKVAENLFKIYKSGNPVIISSTSEGENGTESHAFYFVIQKDNLYVCNTGFNFGVFSSNFSGVRGYKLNDKFKKLSDKEKTEQISNLLKKSNTKDTINKLLKLKKNYVEKEFLAKKMPSQLVGNCPVASPLAAVQCIFLGLTKTEKNARSLYSQSLASIKISLIKEYINYNISKRKSDRNWDKSNWGELVYKILYSLNQKSNNDMIIAKEILKLISSDKKLLKGLLEYGKNERSDLGMIYYAILSYSKVSSKLMYIVNKFGEYITGYNDKGYSVMFDKQVRSVNRSLFRNYDFNQSYGDIILYNAIKSGDFEYFKHLYKNKFTLDFNKCGPNKENVLIIAAKNNNFEIIGNILKSRKWRSWFGGKDIELNAKEKKSGKSFLHYLAAESGSDENISILNSYINEVNKHWTGGYKEYLDLKDKNGDSPFHIAAKNGNIEFILTALSKCTRRSYIPGRSYSIKDIANLKYENRDGLNVYELLFKYKNIVKKLKKIMKEDKSKAKVCRRILDGIKSTDEIKLSRKINLKMLLK